MFIFVKYVTQRGTGVCWGKGIEAAGGARVGKISVWDKLINVLLQSHCLHMYANRQCYF